MNRVSEGFHRIGVVIATPIALAALVMIAMAFQEWIADMAADKISIEKAKTEEKDPNLPDWWISSPILQTKRLEQYMAMPAITLGFSVAAYVGVRSIGWIIRGFMRDPKGR